MLQAIPAAPVLELIGNTPMVALTFRDHERTIYTKAEYLNPSGSIKDRLARYIIEDAEQRGLLRRDGIVVECSSGNTGIALAMVGAVKGYAVRILMSATASVERRHLLHQFGAETVLFEPKDGYSTGIRMARAMAAADPRIFLPEQFENPLNALDHEHHTAPEILRQMDDRVDAFVSGYGTGGTLAGCGRGLRAALPGVRIYAMEPSEAAMLSGECPCCHAIEGIAGGYLPPLVRTAPVDEVLKVGSDEAMAMARRLAHEFGLLVGTSSGANVVAALRVADRLGPHSRVVSILCDRAERYYSTRLFA